jgi:TadE-like protein
MRKSGRRFCGNATIEFTLVGIPLVFVLISTIEMARGMWIYHTLAYAVKEGTRYAVARGQNNPTAQNNPPTPPSYQTICSVVAQAGTGLLQEDLTLRFHSATAKDITCTCSPTGSTSTSGWPACQANPWPPGDNLSVIDNQPGETISITGFYPFVSAISMFWPGAGPGMTFQSLTCQGAGALCLPAASQDVMQF